MCIVRHMQRTCNLGWPLSVPKPGKLDAMQVTLPLREDSGSAASPHGETPASEPRLSPEERSGRRFSIFLWVVSTVFALSYTAV